MERGREQPPGFIATAAPRPSRRVAHAPVSVSRSLAECSSDLRAVCTCVVTCVHAADHTGIALHFQHTSAKVLALLRPSHRQRRAVLGLVKALRYAPTRCCGPAGLDDTCAQLEGSTYVMAEEARSHFSVLTRAASRRMVKISSVPSRTLSAVASDAERCNHRSQSYAAAPSTSN